LLAEIKAEADMYKGHKAQLETRLVVDKKEAEMEMESVMLILQRKNEVDIICSTLGFLILGIMR